MEERLFQMMDEGDLSVLTVRILREQLEEEFSVDLSGRHDKEWIKAAVAEASGKRPRPEESPREETPKRPSKKARTPPDEEKPSSKKPAVRNSTNDEDQPEDDPSMPPLSKAMADVVGVDHANHFRLTKLLWRYIKRHDLQDDENRNVILCDDKLKRVFGRDTVKSFGMAKLIGQHILKDQAASPQATPTKTTTSSKKEYRGSPELAAFCGQETNNRFTITRHLWAHIRANNLQDPNDKRRIIFDDTLRNLFRVDESTSFGLSKLVSTHFDQHHEGN